MKYPMMDRNTYEDNSRTIVAIWNKVFLHYFRLTKELALSIANIICILLYSSISCYNFA